MDAVLVPPRPHRRARRRAAARRVDLRPAAGEPPERSRLPWLAVRRPGLVVALASAGARAARVRPARRAARQRRRRPPAGRRREEDVRVPRRAGSGSPTGSMRRVYCPTWLPDPLVPQIDGRWNNIDSVDPDRSYLVSFVWQETGPGAAGGELHVNLRGYPGTDDDPARARRGGKDKRKIPCFSDPRGTVRANGIAATLYTVNQDADQWHVLLAWRTAARCTRVSRARRAAAHLPQGRRVPEARAAIARPGRARRREMKLTRRQVLVGRRSRRGRRGRALRARRPARGRVAGARRRGAAARRSSTCSTACASWTTKGWRCSCRRSTTRS